MITEEALPHLLRLLDDEEPCTQAALQRQFSESSGDLSHELAALAIDLSSKDQLRLSELLLPGRRETLIQEWQTPEGGAHGLDEDWESFEALLRLISDFLHDGVTLRPSLSDMLDILAEEAEQTIPKLNANSLRSWMFENGRFIGNQNDYYAPQNSDLCWTADTGFGNPISLAVLYMLVGQRLGLEIYGCNYPGHFLAKIHIDGRAMLVDCFHKGKLIPVDELFSEQKQLSQQARSAVQHHAQLGHIISRILRNLEHSFRKLNREHDAELFHKLAHSMEPAP